MDDMTKLLYDLHKENQKELRSITVSVNKIDKKLDIHIKEGDLRHKFSATMWGILGGLISTAGTIAVIWNVIFK